MVYRPVFVAVFLALLQPTLIGASQAGTDRTSSIEIPFVPFANQGAPLIQVTLDGKFTGTFLVDTGADVSIISDDLAKRLSLPTAPASLSEGTPLYFGSEVMMGADVPQVSIGTLLIQDALFGVLPRQDFPQTGEQEVDGIIGASLLSRFSVEIDYPRQEMAFFARGTVSQVELTRLKLSNAACLPIDQITEDVYSADTPQIAYITHYAPSAVVRCSNGSASQSFDVTIDTGAPISLIPWYVSSRLGLSPLLRESASTLYNGSELYNLADVSSLTLGSLTLPDVELGYALNDNTNIPALIGNDILASCVVFFDFTQHKIYLQPVLPPVNGVDIRPTQKPDLPLLMQAVALPYSFDGALAASGSFDDSDCTGRIADLRSKLTGNFQDVDLYLQIAELYSGDDLDTKGHDNYLQAIKILSRQTAISPNNVMLLSKLAWCKAESGDDDDGEQTARRAITLDSNSAAAYDSLGEALFIRSLKMVTGGTKPISFVDGLANYTSLINASERNPLAPTRAALAEMLANEAGDAFNKAVSLAPSDTNVFVTRANFSDRRLVSIDSLIDASSGKPMDVLLCSTTLQAKNDWDLVASLSPGNPGAIRAAALYDMRYADEHEKVKFHESQYWLSHDKETRKQVERWMDQLAYLSRSASPQDSATALEALGEIQVDEIHDYVSAEPTLRKALTLDPSNGAALAQLELILRQNRRYDDLVALLKSQIGKNDSALAEVLLARTKYQLGDYSGALEAAQAAQKMKPTSFTVNMMVAAAALRCAETQPNELSTAGDTLDAASLALGNNPNLDSLSYYELLRSVYDAMTGDSETAVLTALDVLSMQRTNTYARIVLASLIS